MSQFDGPLVLFKSVKDFGTNNSVSDPTAGNFPTAYVQGQRFQIGSNSKPVTCTFGLSKFVDKRNDQQPVKAGDKSSFDLDLADKDNFEASKRLDSWILKTFLNKCALNPTWKKLVNNRSADDLKRMYCSIMTKEHEQYNQRLRLKVQTGLTTEKHRPIIQVMTSPTTYRNGTTEDLRPKNLRVIVQFRIQSFWLQRLQVGATLLIRKVLVLFEEVPDQLDYIWDDSAPKPIKEELKEDVKDNDESSSNSIIGEDMMSYANTLGKRKENSLLDNESSSQKRVKLNQ
jgi:hypothetical protein